jgi:GT2 family glycosyltransferase
MKLSYVIVTHNRCEPLLKTLRILHQDTPLSKDDWEAWVVDNGSTDGTCEAVRSEFPEVKIIARPTNEGVWSRSYAFEPAAGKYLVLLDDDSYPTGDAATRSMAYMESQPKCAAVVGRVVLPDGSYEACAFPAVMLSGAVCIRRSVLLQLGGFRPEFFRKAGEYDLSFRLWDAGYRIERFEDLVYRHDKVTTGRSAGFAHRMDLRNNLILVERYLPADLRAVYRQDFIQRYTALARHAGHLTSAYQARSEAALWRVREAVSGRKTLKPQTIETIFELQSQAAMIKLWAKANGLKRIAIADFSKNIYATYDGCVRAGLEITAISENHAAFAGLNYRGIAVLPDDRAIAMQPDGVVISNVNPAQIHGVERRLKVIFHGPMLKLWRPMLLSHLRQAA